MVADAEMIADRRRLRRKLTVWRVGAVLALIAAVVTVALVARGGPSSMGFASPQIARVSISGFIAGDQRVMDLLQRVGNSSAVAGVVISISSPGGSTTGSEEMYQGVRRLADRKPTVAFVDGMAASGAYITALGADRIVARETSLVGSIGVLIQFPQVSGLLDKVGVQVREIKSSPLKAEPSPFHTPSPESQAALQSVIDDTYVWFKQLVRSRRSLSDAELAAVSDGRIFSGRQSVPLKLIDQVGTERDAIAWLESEKKVARNLPVRDWKPRGSSDFTLWSSAAALADAAGFGGLAAIARAVGDPVAEARWGGLLALWRPAAADR